MRWTPDWRYTYLNKQAERYYGRAKEELLGRSIWEVFPILKSVRSYDEYQRAVRDKVAVHFELDSPTTHRWIEVHAYPGEQGLSVFFRDVSDRKAAEDQVERLNRELNSRVSELETLLDICPVGVWIGNASCDRLIGNQAAYEILGLPFGINASMTSPHAKDPPLVYLKFMIEGQEVAPERLPMHRVARTGVGMKNVEYDVLLADGTLRSIYGSAAPVYDEQGKVRAVIGAHTDITERKQMENALLQADRRKDQFLATLAHELRNPLSPIRSALAILRMETPRDARLVQARDVIDRQVRQMARLLDDLLDVSRVTLNRLELRREQVDLESIINDAIETSRPLIDAGGHALQVTLPAQPVVVDADPARLAQVFSNLLNNAAKYTDAGGRIELHLRTDGAGVVVSVRDNGIGVAPEHLPNVFDMFSQSQPALQRAQGGLGIGLSLTHAIVELHGGRVEAHSAGSGRGSEFKVWLPVSAAQVQRTPAGRAIEHAKPADGQAYKVLIVDDNRDAAESLALYLDLVGYRTQVAHDGLAAVDAASRFLPDVILLDIGLPHLNGYEAAQRIRSGPQGNNVLLVAVTGWGQREDKQKAEDAGFDHHLTKPADPNAITALLQKHRGRCE